MSYRTIPVFPPPANPGIGQGVVTNILDPQTFLTPATKEVVADAALSGVWIHRTPRQVSRRVVDGITPGDICNAIEIVETSSPVLIGIIGTYPLCGLNLSQKVGNKRQYVSPGLVRQYQKFDSIVDRKLSNDRDLASIFSKVIGDKLSDGSIWDLYMRCRMNISE